MKQQHMDQQNNKRKFNPDNLTPGGDDPLKRKNKFNIYWIYGIILIAIISYNLMRGVNSSGIETDQQQFYAMLLNGDVEKIKTIRNKKLVRVFLNKDSLTNKSAWYKQVLNDKEDEKKYDAAASKSLNFTKKMQLV